MAFTVTGNSNTQTITFSDVRSVITSDPFFVKLVFGSKETNSGTHTNTIESLTATLTTSTATVPEPTSMLLLGSGLVALGAWGGFDDEDYLAHYPDAVRLYSSKGGQHKLPLFFACPGTVEWYEMHFSRAPCGVSLIVHDDRLFEEEGSKTTVHRVMMFL